MPCIPFYMQVCINWNITRYLKIMLPLMDSLDDRKFKTQNFMTRRQLKDQLNTIPWFNRWESWQQTGYSKQANH